MADHSMDGLNGGGAYRIEKDSLGEVQVPNEALYGAQTARAIRNFPITGLRPHPALVRATVLVKRAAAETNRSLGELDVERADAIIAAADRGGGGGVVGQVWGEGSQWGG